MWNKDQILTFVLPVNDTRGILVSLEIASPMLDPPQNAVKIAAGRSFFSRTSATNFVIAIVINGVVGAPFLFLSKEIKIKDKPRCDKLLTELKRRKFATLDQLPRNLSIDIESVESEEHAFFSQLWGYAYRFYNLNKKELLLGIFEIHSHPCNTSNILLELWNVAKYHGLEP